MNLTINAEMLKVGKRWMPYILFVLLVAGVAVVVWLFGYVAYKEDQNFQEGQKALRTFAYPWTITALLDNGQFWGTIIFVAIFTSSTMATEYSWGTVRQAIVRGQSRAAYLATKLLGTTIICAAALLGALGVGLLFSAWASAAAGQPITLDVADGPSVPELGLMVLRAGFTIIPYGLLAFCLAVVGRSTALGVGGTFVYMLGEGIVVAILKGLGGTWSDLRDLMIGHNAASLLAVNRIGNLEYNTLAARELPRADELPDVWIATLVLLLYCALFIAISFAVFQRRDIRG